MPPWEATTFDGHGLDLDLGVNRRQSSQHQLSTAPLLQRPELAVIGVGVVELGDDQDPLLGVVLAAEADPKQTLRCE